MKIKAKVLLLTLLVVCISLLTACTAPEWAPDFIKNIVHEHSFSKEWQIVTEPTAETDGVKSNVCDTCNKTVEEPIEKHSHKFSKDWTFITVATDTEKGKKTNVCDVCNLTVTASVAYCADHTFTDEWEIIIAPTHLSLGRMSNDCDVCGATVTDTIPPLDITGVEIVSLPNKIVYFADEKFDSTGLVLSAKLSNGSSIEIKSGWKIVADHKITANDTVAKVKYSDIVIEIPIIFSTATPSAVNNVFNFEDGSELFVKGYCLGSYTAADGAKYYIIKDLHASSTILLKNAKEAYKRNDRVDFFATVASDEYGKLLIYSDENSKLSSNVVSSDNFVSHSSAADKTVLNVQTAESILSTEAKRYQIITFSGTFYIIRNGRDYVLHFNESASDKAGTQLPGGKIIHLSAENVDDTILTDRLAISDLTTYPGSLVSGTVTALYMEGTSDGFYLQILTESYFKLDPYTDGEEYLREIAYAFYYQLPYVDYEQYNIRRNINPAPEDATSQQRIYLDCSSYVNAVYYNAFGVNVMPYTITQKGASTANFMSYVRNNPEAVDVIGYWETRDFETKEERVALLSELAKQLKVGDVIVYRKGNIETLEETAGHTLIYVGAGKFLHCTNTESYTHNGKNPSEAFDTVSSKSIAFETTYNLFEDETATRYLFKYVNFAILRPLNRGLTPTEQTLARMTIPSLSIEKRVDKNMYSAVFKNDLLTYTIVLKNNGSLDLTGIELREFVPMGTEFIEASEGVIFNSGTISWSGSVSANSTVTLTFTVKVTVDQAGALIESTGGSVNGLYLNKITNTLSAISREKLDSLVQAGKDLALENTKFDDPILMLNEIYRELIGRDLLNYASVSDALSDIISLDKNKVNPECDVIDMIIANLSGGYLIRSTNPTNNDRIRALRIEYLSVGDIIIAEHSTDSKGTVKSQVAYVYLGNNEFLEVRSSDGVCKISINAAPSGVVIKNLLTSLYSYEKYAFIRPSLAISAE